MKPKAKKPEIGIIEWAITARNMTNEKPKNLNEAHAFVHFVFAEHPDRFDWQAQSIHDFLSMCPESDAGDIKRLVMLRSLIEKFGPLHPRVIFGIWRVCRAESYQKVSSRKGRSAIKKHPKQTKRAAFVEWATGQISQGATPRNISAIKRLEGFDKAWGTDDTIKKWWKAIKDAPALKPGATQA